MSASPLSRAQKLYGTDAPIPENRVLRAGGLSAELEQGNIRHVRVGDIEVLRGILYLVRDKDWGTYRPAFESLDIDEKADAFTIRYRARCSDGAQSLVYEANITASPERLVFEAEARPDTAFLTARIGFNILHAIEGVAGAPATIEHSDGRVVQSAFPDLIDPWQPFMDIRALTHEPAPGLKVTCRMEGETYEMEDQRNWSDASYKTYARPLALPWPFQLEPGKPVRQRITLDIAGARAAPASHRAAPVTIRIGEGDGWMPKIGLVIAPDQAEATAKALPRERALSTCALRLSYDPTACHGAAALEQFAKLVNYTDAHVTLECVVACTGDLSEELNETARRVDEAGLRLDMIVVCPSVDRQSTPPGSTWPDCPPLEDIYAATREAFSQIPVGGGMFSYFTELNRKRPPTQHIDFVTHATCPIVHAADDVSVMETLEALPFIVRSTRAIIGAKKAYLLGPSTIAMRQNPYGSDTKRNPNRERIAMADTDPRQDGLFAAAFLVGYMARIADGDVAVFTPSALTGPFGLITDDGARRPIFYVVADLEDLARWQRLAATSDAPTRILAVATKRTILIANITSEPQTVQIADSAGAYDALILDAENFDAAAKGERARRRIDLSAPMTLDAYAVWRIDL